MHYVKLFLWRNHRFDTSLCVNGFRDIRRHDVNDGSDRYVNHNLIRISKGSRRAKIKTRMENSNEVIIIKYTRIIIYYNRYYIYVYSEMMCIMNYKYIFFRMFGCKIPTKIPLITSCIVV